MNESRLTSLALMHIHYDKVIDLDRVVDLFSQAHPRRVQLSSILFEVSTEHRLALVTTRSEPTKQSLYILRQVLYIIEGS